MGSPAAEGEAPGAPEGTPDGAVPLLQATIPLGPGRVAVAAFQPDMSDSEALVFIASFLNHLAQARAQQFAASPLGRILGPNGGPLS